MKISVLVLLLLSCASAYTQTDKPPFFEEVEAFKQSDSIGMPPKDAVLFVGSSSIRLWPNISYYFEGIPVIQRGVGGATVEDIMRYQSDIINPYKAKMIMVYVGENDFAKDSTLLPDTVANRAIALLKSIRKSNRNALIIYISMKPSPLRRHRMPLYAAANKKIASWTSGQQNFAYADVYNPMLDGKGYPLPEIFSADSLHMNGNGYKIWAKTFTPFIDYYNKQKKK